MPNSSQIRKVSNPLYILIFTGFDFLISRTKSYNDASTSEYIIRKSKKKFHHRNNFKFTLFLIIYLVFTMYIVILIMYIICIHYILLCMS